MVWFDWCQVIDWYDALDESDILINMDHWYDSLDENDICPSGNQLIKMDHWCDALDENDRCPSGNQLIKMDHWYDALDENDICPSGNQSMQRWIISVLSWLIRCTNGWTPKWSPYGESPHRKMLYGLGYPRRMVGGPMIACGLMRWR